MKMSFTPKRKTADHLSFFIQFSLVFVSRTDLSLIGVDGAAETKPKLRFALFSGGN